MTATRKSQEVTSNTPIYGSIKLFSYDMAGINATDTPITEKIPATVIQEARSEERRVGKECRL